MTDRQLLEKLQAENKALRAEIRKPKRDPVAEALYAENKEARGRIRELERELAPLREAEAARVLRAQEMQAAMAGGTNLAHWNVTREPPKSGPGIPTLVLSDLHVNQTIDPEQVLGVNAFGPERAAERLDACFRTTVDLCLNHMVKPSREGIVIPVLGDLLDLLGGFIHRGERQAKPVGIDAAALVADILQPGFVFLADALGGVRSYWVTGNHPRLTEQVAYEDRNAKSLDYAVFKILEGRLRGDKRITMEHATGPRLIWTVYGHRFLGLHGDPGSGMPKGGDSESGAVNVVARGVKRLRSLHMQIGLPFDTAVMGHFHTRIAIPGAIVNGCLPGYGEYASGRAFPFEPPQQTLFYTHPRHGITCTWPIYLDKPRAARADRAA